LSFVADAGSALQAHIGLWRRRPSRGDGHPQRRLGQNAVVDDCSASGEDMYRAARAMPQPCILGTNPCSQLTKWRCTRPCPHVCPAPLHDFTATAKTMTLGTSTHVLLGGDGSVMRGVLRALWRRPHRIGNGRNAAAPTTPWRCRFDPRSPPPLGRARYQYLGPRAVCGARCRGAVSPSDEGTVDPRSDGMQYCRCVRPEF
jgi:hypothetical protein